jgi:hypothetical protein
MQNGQVNPVTGIFLGKNNFGYTDKTEVAVEPKKTVTNETTMSDVMALIEEVPTMNQLPQKTDTSND